MDWLRWHFVEHRPVIIATVIIVAVFLMLLFIQPPHWGLSNSSSFGPDWECTDHPGGGPTCIKKIRPQT
jgi:hypothetical protein